jgi:hypothetical protein
MIVSLDDSRLDNNKALETQEHGRRSDDDPQNVRDIGQDAYIGVRVTAEGILLQYCKIH